MDSLPELEQLDRWSRDHDAHWELKHRAFKFYSYAHGKNFVQVAVRRKKTESLQLMLLRGVAEVQRQLGAQSSPGPGRIREGSLRENSSPRHKARHGPTERTSKRKLNGGAMRTKDSNGGTYAAQYPEGGGEGARGKAVWRIAAAFLALCVLSACNLWPPPSGPTQTVIVTQQQGGGGTNPSPSPGTALCTPDRIVLGSAGDDFVLVADGEDTVTLVPSYYLQGAELTAAQCAAVVPTPAITGACGRSGTFGIIATAPGTCTVTLSVGAVPSNPLTLTAVAP